MKTMHVFTFLSPFGIHVFPITKWENVMADVYNSLFLVYFKYSLWETLNLWWDCSRLWGSALSCYWLVLDLFSMLPKSMRFGVKIPRSQSCFISQTLRWWKHLSNPVFVKIRWGQPLLCRWLLVHFLGATLQSWSASLHESFSGSSFFQKFPWWGLLSCCLGPLQGWALISDY